MTKKYMMEDLNKELTFKELIALIPIKETTLRARINNGNRTIKSLTHPQRKKYTDKSYKEKYGNSWGLPKQNKLEDKLFTLAMRKI